MSIIFMEVFIPLISDISLNAGVNLANFFYLKSVDTFESDGNCALTI